MVCPSSEPHSTAVLVFKPPGFRAMGKMLLVPGVVLLLCKFCCQPPREGKGLYDSRSSSGLVKILPSSGIGWISSLTTWKCYHPPLSFASTNARFCLPSLQALQIGAGGRWADRQRVMVCVCPSFWEPKVSLPPLPFINAN